MKIAMGIVILVALIVAVLVVTDYWQAFLDLFTGGESNILVSSVIFVIVIVAAVAIVLSGAKKAESAG